MQDGLECGLVRATWKRAASLLTSRRARWQKAAHLTHSPASRHFPPAPPVPGTRAESPQGPGEPAGGGCDRVSRPAVWITLFLVID